MSDQSPIVIFGGFLSFPGLYSQMRQTLQTLSRNPVTIVPAYSHDWLAGMTLSGNARLLDMLDRTVRRVAASSVDGKVSLVAHSQGGVLARLYLSPEEFLGRCYCGSEVVDHLICLGSPHQNQAGRLRGGLVSRYIERHCPANCLAPHVRYTCVAGKLIRGSLLTSPQARQAYHRYQELCGDGAVWGDGLIPLPSALLPGAEQVVLEGVSHISLVGASWYGSPEIIPLWWRAGSDPEIQQTATKEKANDRS